MVFFTKEEVEIISKIILKRTGNYLQARALAELYKTETGLSIDTFNWEIIESSLTFGEQKNHLLEIIKGKAPGRRIYKEEYMERANIENLVEAIISNIKTLIKEDRKAAEERALAIVKELDIEIPFAIEKEYDELKEEYERLKERYNKIYEQLDALKKKILGKIEYIKLKYDEVESIVKHYVSQIKDEHLNLKEEFERLNNNLKDLSRIKKIVEEQKEPKAELKFEYIQCPGCGTYKIVHEDVGEFFRRTVLDYRTAKRNLKGLDMKDLLLYCSPCFYSLYEESFKKLQFFPQIREKSSIIEDVLNFTLGYPYLYHIFYNNVRALGYTTPKFRTLLRLIKERCTLEEVHKFEEEIKKAKKKSFL